VAELVSGSVLRAPPISFGSIGPGVGEGEGLVVLCFLVVVFVAVSVAGSVFRAPPFSPESIGPSVGEGEGLVVLAFFVVSFLVVSVDDFLLGDFLVFVDITAVDFSGAVAVVVVSNVMALSIAAAITRVILIGGLLNRLGLKTSLEGSARMKQ